MHLLPYGGGMRSYRLGPVLLGLPQKLRDVGHPKTPPRSEATIWPVVDRLVTPHNYINYGRLIETDQPLLLDI